MPATVRRTTALATASIALLAAFAAAPPAVASPAHAARTGPVAHLVDGDLSGYAATGATFSSVSSSWIQPTATCAGSASVAAFWVGLDGVDDNTVEQIGTETDCSGGSASYVGWYEMYPAAPVYFGDRVSAGDTMTASVTTNGSTLVTVTLTDATKGWSEHFNKTVSGAKYSSAEVITELPNDPGSQPPSGRVSFTNSLVNGSALGKFDPELFEALGTTVSPLNGGGNFTVTWS